jgi:hypothetical protein
MVRGRYLEVVIKGSEGDRLPGIGQAGHGVQGQKRAAKRVSSDGQPTQAALTGQS